MDSMQIAEYMHHILIMRHLISSCKAGRGKGNVAIAIINAHRRSHSLSLGVVGR